MPLSPKSGRPDISTSSWVTKSEFSDIIEKRNGSKKKKNKFEVSNEKKRKLTP